jgi:hypothetical protein
LESNVRTEATGEEGGNHENGVSRPQAVLDVAGKHHYAKAEDAAEQQINQRSTSFSVETGQKKDP